MLVLELVKKKEEREDEAEGNSLQSVNFLIFSNSTHKVLLRMERDSIRKMFSRVRNQKAGVSLTRGFL